MPYLDPAQVLQRFSSFLLKQVRSALREDEKLVRAQVGSMASMMNFLSRELRQGHRIPQQQQRLRQALDGFENRLSDRAAASQPFQEPLREARRVVASLEPDREDVEQRLLEPVDDLLAAIDRHADPAEASALREPLYGFLQYRLRTQLEMLGRDPDPHDE